MADQPRFGSDLVADLLADLGITYVAANPGATFRGLHDSLVNHRSDVALVECAHEEIAVGIAHGYAKATGRPMAVAVHDVVGLQHASMAIYNAWCDRVPVLVLGGTGPVDAARRRPWIDWIHTANPQATQVRDYTKWDDQPASIEAVPESMIRAAQLATAAPPGPVYVCLDSDVQEAELDPTRTWPRVADFAGPGRIAPAVDAVATIVDWLFEADAPAIAVESVDGDARAVDDLAYLATKLGVAVVEPARDYGRPALCLPTAHPMNVTGAWGDLPPADVVLSLEVRDLDAVRVTRTAEARVAVTGTATLGVKAWAADLQRLPRADLSVAASPSLVLAALRTEVDRRGEPVGAAERRRRIAEHTRAARGVWQREAQRQPADGTITQPFLASCVWEAVRAHRPVLANGSLSDWAHRVWSLDAPEDYLGSSGGAGLGYGLPASIGAALAHRDDDRLVVDLQSDGDLLMTPSALWTAAHERVPMLIVVDNNRAYQNSVQHARAVAAARGRDVGRAHVATRLDDPAVDLAGLARSMGLIGVGPVADPALLPDLLAGAVEQVVTQRQAVLVDVRTEAQP